MKNKFDPSALSADELQSIKAEIKAELLQEIKSDREKDQLLIDERKLEEQQKQKEYVDMMKKSPDPWVEMVGDSVSDKGVRVEMEWNDAFIAYLRTEGFTGIEEDDLVQKWLNVLITTIDADAEEERVESDFQ